MNDEHRTIEQLITSFCEIILTQNDNLNHQDATNYIKSLTDKEISLLNSYNLDEKCSIVRNMLMTYIQSYQSEDGNPEYVSPFEFDSGNNFDKYKEHFELEYKKHNNQADIPKVLNKAFELIQEMSEHYRIFEQFYNIRSLKSDDFILAKLGYIIKQTADNKITKGVEEGLAKAVKLIEDETQKASNEIVKNIPETTVTILGIFAGIVLAVVAGLFYSSTVINNINSASIYKLISVSALVGFVCYSLVALMFRYIERIKYKNDKMPRFNLISIIVGSALLVVMIVFGILQASVPDNTSIQNQSKVNANISFEVEQSEESIVASESLAIDETAVLNTNINEGLTSSTTVTE